MKSIGLFFLGCICGGLLFGLVHVFKSTAVDFKTLDRTDVYSDQQVRQAIKNSGVALPTNSWDLFYAISGFQDHGVWIALTVPPDQLWAVVEASVHKTKNDFTAGVPESFLDRVELGADQKIDTNLWNPQTIKTSLHFSIKEKGSYFEDWVVDEENGRIFITKSNT